MRSHPSRPWTAAPGPFGPAAETVRALLFDSTRPLPPTSRPALANALDDGLMPDEVMQILAGRRIAEAFPVRWGESPEAYASRPSPRCSSPISSRRSARRTRCGDPVAAILRGSA